MCFFTPLHHEQIPTGSTPAVRPPALDRVAEFFAPAALAAYTALRMPAAAKALKGTKGTKATATVTDIVNATNAFIAMLTSAQQALVVEAMRPWVQDSDDATAASLMATYTNQLAGTYISYAGTGNLTTNGDNVRIDGPNAWIEFVCQTGVVYRSQIHYHSVWRDHTRDYGGNFSGYVTVTGTQSARATQRVTVE